MAWSEHEIEIITRMWQAGDTASTIADAIGAGKSRSAVVAKAHRLGLDARENPIAGGKALHTSVTRKLHMRLQRLGLATGGREGIIEAFAFTETATPEQVSRALGAPIAKVEAAVEWLEANYGGDPA